MSNAARLDLARELHDGIAQDLIALGYEIDLLLAHSDSSNQSRKEIRGLRFRVDEMISKVRREMYELRDLKMESVQDYLSKNSQQLCGSVLTKFYIEDFLRPTIERKPSSSIFPKSPDLNQRSSVKTSELASSFCQ